MLKNDFVWTYLEQMNLVRALQTRQNTKLNEIERTPLDPLYYVFWTLPLSFHMPVTSRFPTPIS